MKILLSFLFALFAYPGFAQEFNSEDVIFSAKEDTLRFGATITSPKTKGSFPALVLISGSGPQDRNGTMAGQPLFAQIAEYLSSRGYVVLRMDDRGVGKTSGKYSNATTADFARDALQAVNFLKDYPKVDNKHIGLLGHSEGGAAISIAASRSKDVGFLVSLAGVAASGMESLLLQNEALVNSAPTTPINKGRFNEINRLMFSVAYQYAESDSLERKLMDTYNYWKEKDNIYFKSLGLNRDGFFFPLTSYVKQATEPWYRYSIRYNPQLFLSRVDVPILAINGDRDLFVSPINLTYWKSYSQSGQKGRVTTKLLKNVNHLMQECKVCDVPEFKKLGPMPISTLQLITEWLDSTVKK